MYKTTPVEQNVKIEKIYKQMDIARSLVLCVCFVDLVCPLIFCPFSSGRCIVGPSVYSFWLSSSYLQNSWIYVWNKGPGGSMSYR